MEQSINFSQGITSIMGQYKNMLQQLKRQKQQLAITMLFKKTTVSTLSEYLTMLMHFEIQQIHYMWSFQIQIQVSHPLAA